MAWIQGTRDAELLGPYRPTGGPPVPYGAYENYLVPIGAVHEGPPADGPASSSFGPLGALGARGSHDLTAKQVEALLSNSGPGSRAIVYAHKGDPRNGRLRRCSDVDTVDQTMIKIERRSFINLQEFREYAWRAAPVVYYYVFSKIPDQLLIDAVAGCGPDESLVLLDISEDRGFLRQTDVTVDITPDRTFVTRKMAERPGLGAWARGTSVGFVTGPSEVAGLIHHARLFALPVQRTSEDQASEDT